jgi:hypothetical protein
MEFRICLLAILPALALMPLVGCVGGTLGDSSEFEMYPLRPASKSEAKDLKHCLRTAHEAQDGHRKRTGHYVRRVKDLPLDGACHGLRLGQKGTPTGYEISARLNEDETSVLWSVNEKGVIEEHLDPEGDADLEF